MRERSKAGRASPCKIVGLDRTRATEGGEKDLSKVKPKFSKKLHGVVKGVYI